MGWLDELVAHAHESLSGERELVELWSRGATDEQISAYKIGYINTLPPTLQTSKEFSAWWGAQKLRDVYVFPLTSALGQVKGLQFRHVEREVRGYMDYFLAKDEPAYFGLHQAMPHIWESRSVCLVEGAFDLFPVQRVFPWTVPTMTSSVSTAFLAFLRRVVKEVWFFYDMDKAGRAGVVEFTTKHREEFSRVLSSSRFPRFHASNGKRVKDPSEAWEVLGDERFGVCVKSAFEEVPLMRRGHDA